MIKTLLIDDEPKALGTLKNKITKYCPTIEVIAETQNPKEAITLIKKLKPQLIFLDIAMPGLSGFEVLEQIEEPDFEIIFATAFDNYAIEAIKHCAIGYLVKPIDNEELLKAVAKATENLNEKSALKKNKLLIENLSVKKFQDKKIIVPTQDGLEFIAISDIIHCEGTDGYTSIHLKEQKPLLSSNSIGHFSKMLVEKDFYLVHKSHLINLDYIDKYLNEGYVVIKDKHIPVSRNRRNDFLNMLKKK